MMIHHQSQDHHQSIDINSDPRHVHFKRARILSFTMIIPRALRSGDVIGVTAPSAGITEEIDRRRFSNARRRLEDRGYKVVETPGTFMCDDNGRSCSPQQRVSEFESLLKDRNVAAIFAASGGDYECEMLPFMDWDVIEKNPKWFQGYSDNTVLSFKITAEHDIATTYSGNYGDFGMEPLHQSIEQNLEILEGRRRSQTSFQRHASGFTDRVTGLEPFQEDAISEWHCNRNAAKFSGRMIGGCMDVIEWFLHKGTADAKPFVDKYAGDGIIWYLETYDMTDDRVRSVLKDMDGKGWLEGCSGFVFGRPLFYHGKDYGTVVTEYLKELDLPILWDADIGHKPPRMTIINGAKATFSFSGRRCDLEYDDR